MMTISINRDQLILSILVVGICLTFGTAARSESDDKEQARKHFKTGMSLLEEEQFESAAKEFKASVSLYPTKNGYFNLAACYFEMNRASDAMTTILQLEETFRDDLDEKWKEQIDTFERKLINTVVPMEFKINIRNFTLKVDGKEIPDATTPGSTQYIDPGEHKISILAEGYKTINETVYLKAGQGRTVLQFVMVQLVDESSEKTSKDEETLEQNTTYPVHFENNKKSKKSKKQRKIGTIVAFSLAGATGAAAITTGVMNLVNVSLVRDRCGGDVCVNEPELEKDFDSVLKLGVATNVLIAVTAVGIVTGTVLAFVEGRSKKKKRRVSAGPSLWEDGGGLVLSGEF